MKKQSKLIFKKQDLRNLNMNENLIASKYAERIEGNPMKRDTPTCRETVGACCV